MALPVSAGAIRKLLREVGPGNAAREPLLRAAVSDQLVASFARKNGIVAAAVWIRGADLPLLALFGVAYAGTRALGEAARLRFALAPTQPLGGAARAAP